ncbi:MAG: heme exporter protein CcmD [Halieaceae bacterium]|nr:heme exporter protein CcmD [Halieaceae bacterium]
MQFESLTAAWNMAGHGPYVWFVFAAAALTVTALLVAPVLRSRRVIRLQRRRWQREQRLSGEGQHAPGT